MNIIKKGYYLFKRVKKVYKFKNSAKGTPLKIVIGAGGIYEEGWLPTEIDVLNLLRPKEWERLLSKNSIDAILAEHVWEHLTKEQGFLAATTCYSFLKTGGYIRVAVPDGYHPEKNYIEHVKPGGVGAGADDHKVLYTYKSFSEIFEKAGFKVKLLEFFDEYGEFHFLEWNEEDGKILRSQRFDERNVSSLSYTSIIIDAIK